jgi:ankyrin repeat protein
VARRAGVRALLAAGAGTATQDQIGRTALDVASDGGHLGVVQALLAAGAGTAAQGQPMAEEETKAGPIPNRPWEPHRARWLTGK